MQRHYLEEHIIPPIVSIIELYLNDWLHERQQVITELKRKIDTYDPDVHWRMSDALLPVEREYDTDDSIDEVREEWYRQDIEDCKRCDADPRGYIKIRPLLMSQIRYNARQNK